jgi:hypothetical protein
VRSLTVAKQIGIKTRVHKLVVQFLNTCHIFISYIIVARRVAHKVQLIWINMYG